MSNAFNNALALESVGEIGIFDAATETYSGVTSDDLVKYARTVAYKVFHNIKNGHVMSKEEDPLTVDGALAAEAWAHHYEPAAGFNKSVDDMYRAMVNRFLSWKLPADFVPDAGISFLPLGEHGTHFWPSGTNLLHSGQAMEMFKHCVELPAAEPEPECCGKCQAEPASDLPPVHAAITEDGAPTQDEFRAAIKDLATRLQTADLVILTLLHKAGGSVTLVDADGEAVLGKAVVTEADSQDKSITFRLVDAVQAPAAVK